MKHVITAAFAASLLLLSPAQGAQTDLCAEISAVAEHIMDGRQSGVPIRDLMAEVPDAFRELVIEAYERPRFTTPQRRQSAVTDFGNKVYLICDRLEQEDQRAG